MPKQQKRFEKDLETEAVCLVQTSGRTPRAKLPPILGRAFDIGALDQPQP